MPLFTHLHIVHDVYHVLDLEFHRQLSIVLIERNYSKIFALLVV